MKMPEVDVIKLAREADLCYPDCNFLDSNPFEKFPEVIAELKTEAEREEYLRLAAAEEQQRMRLLHKLESFAARVLWAAQAYVLEEARDWKTDEGKKFAAGAIKACARLEFVALTLEKAHADGEN
jgi:hypothetical protein